MASRRKRGNSVQELIIFILLFIMLPLLGIYLLLQPERWKKVIGAICLVAGIGIWGYTIYDSVYLPKMDKKMEQENLENHTFTMGCGIQVILPKEWELSEITVEMPDDFLMIVYDKDSVEKGYNGRLLYVKCCTKEESYKLYNESEADFEFKYIDSSTNEYRYVYSVSSYYNTENYTYPEREEYFHQLEDDMVWGMAVIPVDRDKVEYSRD